MFHCPQPIMLQTFQPSETKTLQIKKKKRQPNKLCLSSVPVGVWCLAVAFLAPSLCRTFKAVRAGVLSHIFEGMDEWACGKGWRRTELGGRGGQRVEKCSSHMSAWLAYDSLSVEDGIGGEARQGESPVTMVQSSASSKKQQVVLDSSVRDSRLGSHLRCQTDLAV